jgi:hypothetical protein
MTYSDLSVALEKQHVPPRHHRIFAAFEWRDFRPFAEQRDKDLDLLSMMIDSQASYPWMMGLKLV